ncbi:hypothetical protein CVT24_000139 [Panaeolus cyanescens]|uniref:G domain-containing protein n=1 Tax=Panaeolus cyanescens TaxID=181874 RepID=A0A409VS33_9AGAR|nr:hypothetical protein CVT24_000139 [Panaeolus cyanescens]
MTSMLNPSDSSGGAPGLELHLIRPSGPLSAKRIPEDYNGYIDGWVILLMGPTGSGKSTFIEAVVNNRHLGIAKDQLEGFTQRLTAYRVSNLMSFGRNIYLVDTPGLSDPKIPESRTIREIQQWMVKYNIRVIERLFYFDRIMDTRMSGSKTKALNIFKAITGQDSRFRVHVITTMWDQIWTSGQEARANERYEQLQKEHWKDFATDSRKFKLRMLAIVKFTNTQESALGILDSCLGTSSGKFFRFEEHLSTSKIEHTTYGKILQANLFERHLALQQRLQVIQEDLNSAEAQESNELRSILYQHRIEVERCVRVVEKELKAMGAFSKS